MRERKRKKADEKERECTEARQKERKRVRAKKVREKVFYPQYKSLLRFSGGRGGGLKAIPRTACCGQKSQKRIIQLFKNVSSKNIGRNKNTVTKEMSNKQDKTVSMSFPFSYSLLRSVVNFVLNMRFFGHSLFFYENANDIQDSEWL